MAVEWPAGWLTWQPGAPCGGGGLLIDRLGQLIQQSGLPLRIRSILPPPSCQGRHLSKPGATPAANGLF